MIKLYTDGAVEYAANGTTILQSWKFQRGESGRWFAVVGEVDPNGIRAAGTDKVDITEVINNPEARPGGRPTLAERLQSLTGRTIDPVRYEA